MGFSKRYSAALLALFYLHQANSFAFFRARIPNGDKVPHPCNPLNSRWRGVGHLVESGGGKRNPFGEDFDKEGKKWTRALCLKDSDGDGRTNGEELGDPGCTWTEGGTPSRTTGLSHPGFCDPLDSDTCSGSLRSTFCDSKDFNCPATKETGTFEMNVTIPVMPVPAVETTYMCMRFEFPDDQDYHMVGFLEQIDNYNVMHHIVVYGCASDQADHLPVNRPYSCFMSGGDTCETFIGLWGLGFNGYCFHPSSGIRVGKNGFKRAVIELHWNNPYKTSTYTDGSGITFYLTPNLREQNAGIASIGQSVLEIPPKEEMYSQKGVCSSSCTAKLLKGPIYITSVANHMHYLGQRVISEVVHPGQRVDYLGYDAEYNYDKPVMHQYTEPILVNPGDKLEVDCFFNSMSRSKTTEWGSSTNAEMCYAFITFYPQENFISASCDSFRGFDQCELEQEVLRGCNLTRNFDSSLPENIERYMKLNEYCVIGHCKKECKTYIKQLKQHACFQEELIRYFRSYSQGHNEDLYIVQRYYSLFASCDTEFYIDKLREQQQQEEEETSGAQRGSSPPWWILTGVIAAVLYKLI